MVNQLTDRQPRTEATFFFLTVFVISLLTWTTLTMMIAIAVHRFDLKYGSVEVIVEVNVV